ncbi:hypothetical protein [Sorangium sp. So ce145]|uniref:hypothetical protein n=1 Tax=Sorangium sp. So ce145 TaxID=3133285 RepID=UPI003F620C98
MLWRRALPRGVRNPTPEIEQTALEEQVQASSDRLDFIAATPPPLVNAAHDDLAWKLDDYTGYPAPGALTPGMIAAVVKGKHIVAPWAVAPGSGGFAFNILDWARYAIAHLRDTSPAFTSVHALDFSSYNRASPPTRGPRAGARTTRTSSRGCSASGTTRCSAAPAA